MKHLTTLLLLLGLLSFSLPSKVAAQFDNPFDDSFLSGPSDDPNAAQVSLVADVTSVKPGEPFQLAVKITHPDKFHSYYKNGGGFGQPLKFNFTAPQGTSVSELAWPTPHVLWDGNPKARTFSYGHDAYFLTTVTPSASLSPGDTLTLSVTATVQMCEEGGGCGLPQDLPAKLTLPVATSSEKNTSLFNAKAELPVQDDAWKFSIHPQGKSALILSITSPIDLTKVATLTFIDDHGLFDGTAAQVLRQSGDNYLLGLTLAEGAEAPDTVTGILTTESHKIGEHAGILVNAKLGSELEEVVNVSPTSNKKPMGLFFILGGMALGGFILNLMPCVFPVIGIKIMGFVQQAGEDTKKIKLHGLSFTAGVFLSFIGLAAVIFPIRATTTLGAQLQNPIVVLVVMLIMFVLALSMFGLFEIGTSATGAGGKLSSKDGLAGSFFSGVLAVIVATPCSAPFLGPAAGAAWNLEGPLFFAAFLSMAFGLSLPYIILSFIPSLVNKLPRPGAWMESFKQGMSFLLFATAGFLLWVYMALVGEQADGLKGLFVVIGLTLIAVAAWVYGRWSLPYKSMKTRMIARILTLVFATAGIILAKPSENKLNWQKWSPETVEKHLSEGKPVYVDFTAKWCVTCQTNKATAYTDEVIELFEKYEVVLLKADLTEPDEQITKAVRNLGRSAIPVNVLYVPGKDEPIITPEALTSGYMKGLLNDNLAEYHANKKTAPSASEE